MIGGSYIETVDWLLIGVIGLTTLDGVRRGLLISLLDLAAAAIAIMAALYLYEGLAGLAETGAGLSGDLVRPVTFAATILLISGICAAVVDLIGKATSPVGLLVPFWSPTRLAGLVPGALRGVVIAALLVQAVYAFRPSADLVETVSTSTVAGQLSALTERALPILKAETAEVAERTSQFVPPIKEGERRDLSIPHGITIWADPESEAQLLRLINQERSFAGLPALVADQRIQTVARQHSEEMFRLAYFSHDSPLSGSPFDRLRDAGITYGTAGENLAYAPTADSAHRGLMNSPEHRANILSPAYRRIGIGVMQSAIWGRMVTEDFTD